MLSKFSKRTKLLLALFLALVLVSGGAFGVLIKTGKIKIGADTLGETKIYTITGRSYDPSGPRPMANIPVTITTEDGQILKTETNEDGRYFGRIQTIPGNLINVSEDLNDGLMEGTSCDLIASIRNTNLECNFNIGRPPFDRTSLKEFLNQDVPNEIAQNGQEKNILGLQTSQLPELNKKFDIRKVGGINFFTFKDPYYSVPFSSNKSLYTKIASQIVDLNKRTSLNNIPGGVLVVQDIYWIQEGEGVAGAFYRSTDFNDPSDSLIVLSQRYIKTDMQTVNHEFGHAVDWYRGYEDPGFEGEWGGCAKERCSMSSSIGFKSAYKQTVNWSTTLDGYGATKPQEMFAEFFTGITYIGPADNPETFKNSIKNYLFNRNYLFFARTTLMFLSGESIDIKLKNHNSLIYMYILTADTSHLDKYFPGKIINNTDWPSDGSSPVVSGAYMGEQGVVSLKLLDHYNNGLGNAIITISDQIGKTASDSSLLGTTVLMPTPVNVQDINISSIPGYLIPSAEQTIELSPGSNYIEVKMVGNQIPQEWSNFIFDQAEWTVKDWFRGGESMELSINPATGKYYNQGAASAPGPYDNGPIDAGIEQAIWGPTILDEWGGDLPSGTAVEIKLCADDDTEKLKTDPATCAIYKPDHLDNRYFWGYKTTDPLPIGQYASIVINLSTSNPAETPSFSCDFILNYYKTEVTVY